MICTHDHDVELPMAEFQALPESQRGRWRHVCAGCAYHLGRAHAEAAEGRLRQRVRELEARLKQAQANG
jgi:hypothetical protein